MTKEEKSLLFIDLCARLPYSVKVCFDNIIKETIFTPNELLYLGSNKHSIKPYLRPMSSMTEEELNELLDSQTIDFDGNGELIKRAVMAFHEGKRLESNALFSIQYAKVIDWLNAHHFDYRGLIEKGLALEAPEGMYDIMTTSI